MSGLASLPEGRAVHCDSAPTKKHSPLLTSVRVPLSSRSPSLSPTLSATSVPFSLVVSSSADPSSSSSSTSTSQHADALFQRVLTSPSSFFLDEAADTSSALDTSSWGLEEYKKAYEKSQAQVGRLSALLQSFRAHLVSFSSASEQNEERLVNRLLKIVDREKNERVRGAEQGEKEEEARLLRLMKEKRELVKELERARSEGDADR